jgi:hypothetical protein
MEGDPQAIVPCDGNGNGNGNVSFGECYSCINDAIDANPTSSFICDVPILGWIDCWASITVACIYISANY